LAKHFSTITGYVHVRLKVRGPADAVELFHMVIEDLDTCYPYKLNISRYASVQECPQCGGRRWYGPRVMAQDLKAAARQCGVKVKIIRFAMEDKCGKDLKWIEIKGEDPRSTPSNAYETGVEGMVYA
jgi:hypothetical protein